MSFQSPPQLHLSPGGDPPWREMPFSESLMSDRIASLAFLGSLYFCFLYHLFFLLGDFHLLGGRFPHLEFLKVLEINFSAILEEREDAMIAVVIESPPVTCCGGVDVIDHPEIPAPRIPCPLCFDCSPEILLPLGECVDLFLCQFHLVYCFEIDSKVSSPPGTCLDDPG